MNSVNNNVAKKKVAIIGSGISGFSCGINLLLKGFDVSIYEKNSFYGGCCGAYEENGVLFDHCIHWMIGTNPASKENKMWVDIHAFTGIDSIYTSEYLSSFVFEGKTLHIHRDYKKNIEEWLNESNADKRVIKRVNKQFKHAYNFFGKHNIFKKIPFLFDLIKGLLVSREDVANKFKHPGLRALIESSQNGSGCWTFFLFEYGHFMNDNAGIPQGGSKKVIDNIKNYYEELGGKLFLNSPVNRINVENKTVKSIEVNNKVVDADYFVSACAPEHTLNVLLNSKYKHHGIAKLRKHDNKYKTVSCLQINYICSGDTSNIPNPCGFYLKKPQKVGSSDVDFIFVRTYNYDEKCYLKDGKIPFVVFVDQYKEDYEYFASLNQEEYEQEKKRISDALLEEIESQFPNLKGKLMYSSMMTPISYSKALNSPYGAYMGFTIPKKGMIKVLKLKIKGIKNLYFASNWMLTPGGTPFANLNGIRVSKKINK